MDVLAQTRVVLWEGGSLWLVDAARFEGETRTTDFHAHHAIQVTLSLGGCFRLVAEDDTSSTSDTVVAADALHRFEAEGRFALVFVEPESRLGRAVAARHIAGTLTELAPSPVLSAELDAFRTSDWRAPDSELLAWGRRLLGVLAADERAEIPDYRIRKVIGWASERLDGTLSLADAVPVAGLSSSRLRHLFVEQTGLPFKTYLLWLRLSRALAIVAAGSPLTAAAHEAGFSDSAHLSRTFRRMFGVAPTALQMLT
ncbi:AraC family transcriptional regulator [Brevundimonas sp.]|uniref:helix-turn-helix transcriptional regulator n=1 Tax=Brevundimonas sp. TaxID=1871086 RepID=UPI002D2477CB|nr:AraC family transcriptional regulator [Brevundimonas sp.]HYD26334.1 AraC family transcriptional regulator [Brevundimonas sp.]